MCEKGRDLGQKSDSARPKQVKPAKYMMRCVTESEDHTFIAGLNIIAVVAIGQLRSSRLTEPDYNPGYYVPLSEELANRSVAQSSLKSMPAKAKANTKEGRKKSKP